MKPEVKLCSVKPVRLTQHSQSVVKGNHNDVSIAGQDAAIDHVPCAFHVRSAVNVYHDRPQTILVVDVWKSQNVNCEYKRLRG